MPHTPIKLAFIKVDMITDPTEVNPCLLAKGAADMISQLHVDHYEIIYLHSKALYHQETIGKWLDDNEILYPSHNVAQPPRLVFGEPNVFMVLEPRVWEIGIIQMFAVMRKADEVIIVDKMNDKLLTFIQDHPNHTYFKEGDKRYPSYMVTLIEKIEDIAITWKKY